MVGIIINKIKYVHLSNDNNLKKKSLYDNIYFTLKDIFVNANAENDFMCANMYNSELTDGICFEDRTHKFEYTNVLEQTTFVKNLKKWFDSLKIDNLFEFEQVELEKVELEQSEFDNLIFFNKINKINREEYIKLDNWWIQFEELKCFIDEQYEKICMDMK